MELTEKLVNAVNEGDLESVEELLEDNVPPETIDVNGNSILMLAAINNDYDMVSLIIDYLDSEDLSDALGYSDEIDKLLFSCGAIRDIESYSESRFSGDYEEVYTLEEELVFEAVNKLFKFYGIDIENTNYIKNIDNELPEQLIASLEILGVESIIDGKIEFNFDSASGTFDIVDILEELGYDVIYEGTSNRLEGTTGMYYLE